MMLRCVLIVVLFFPALLAGQEKSLTAGVLTAEERSSASGMLAQHARAGLSAANQRSTAAWKEITTPAEWEKRRDAWLAALRKSLGEYPPPPESIAVTITQTQTVGEVRIDSIVYESRPGWLVTANLYSPSKLPASLPGFLLSHSHHTPKSQGELQEMGQLWARAGCYVLVPDHLGHGERRQHAFKSAEDYPAAKFQVSRQDYHFRFNTAAQLYAIGDSLMGWMSWDLMRGVDVLLKQPGIDKQRIILLGGVAGGGDPAGVTAALDARITGLCPMNFGGPQPETRYPLPEDAEQKFNYAGGGSWESTRNLHRSAADGFLPWVIVGSVAPRALIHGHEFAWDRERDPVWKRYQQIYKWYDASEKLGVAFGYGAVTQSGDVASHCGNIGKLHRGPMHAYFAQWFAIQAKEEAITRKTAEELACLTGDKGSQLRSMPLHQLAQQLGDARRDRMQAELQTAPTAAQRLTILRGKWEAILGEITPAKFTAEARRREEIMVGQQQVTQAAYLLKHGDMLLPVLLLTNAKSSAKQPTVLIFAQQGKEAWLKERSQTAAALLPKHTLCIVDLRGCGETKPGNDRGRRSEATSLWASEIMLGQTLIGGRLQDVRTTLAWLRMQPGVDAARLFVWGDSLSPVNPADTVLARPLELDQPSLGEPMGATVALLTGLFEDRLAGVIARGGLVEYRALLASPYIHIAHDAIVPGAIAAGDLRMVLQQARQPLLIADCIDSGNRRVALPAETLGITLPAGSRTAEALAEGDLVKWIEEVSSGR